MNKYEELYELISQIELIRGGCRCPVCGKEIVLSGGRTGRGEGFMKISMENHIRTKHWKG